jgi:hypothetical protein
LIEVCASNRLLHLGVAAAIPLFAQALKNALRCMPLLFDQGFVSAQYLVDNTDIIVKRWATWRF